MLPAKFNRYAAVAWLLMKYRRAAGTPADPPPNQLADDLENLGPTFIKLGQLLSTRPDLLPAPYLDALARLQDDVAAFSFEQVRQTIEDELGVRLSKAFSRLDELPSAAASLGQVHRAALRDGRQVAVKVQRPGIVEQIHVDLEALGELAAFLDKHSEAGRRYNAAGIIAEFSETLLAELDYRREANNLRLIGRNLAEFPAIVVPLPVDGYTTARVLTMDYVSGTKVTALSRLARLDIDGAALANTLVRAYLKQIVIDGVFHADPHPGNVLLTPCGQLALIDLGMIGRIGPIIQERLFKLLLAVSDGRGDESAEAALGLCERLATHDERQFRQDIGVLVSRYAHESLGELQVGRVFMELHSICAAQGLRPPADLTMLGKTLLHLDQVARALDPTMDVNATIRRDASALMARRLKKSVTAAGVFATVLEAKEFAERLPARVNRVLDALSTSELKLKVELIDEGAVMHGLQKVANRITLGLILAALIVGAAMIMSVPTSFRLFGYPGLAMILFVLAGMGGLWLALHIVTQDHVTRHRPTPRASSKVTRP